MRYAKHNLREKKQLTVTAPELNGPNFCYGSDTGTSYDSWPDEKLYLSDMDDISAEEDESETTMSDTKDQSQYTRKRKRPNAASSLDSQTKHTAHYPPDLERTFLECHGISNLETESATEQEMVGRRLLMIIKKQRKQAKLSYEQRMAARRRNKLYGAQLPPEERKKAKERYFARTSPEERNAKKREYLTRASAKLMMKNEKLLCKGRVTCYK
jgi:hypothetical protein